MASNKHVDLRKIEIFVKEKQLISENLVRTLKSLMWWYLGDIWQW